MNSSYERPNNLMAERAVLGALILDPERVTQVRTLLNESDFFREAHGWVYRAILALEDRKEKIDYITLTAELERTGQLVEAGGPGLLTSLLEDVPTASYALHYAELVARAAALRAQICVAEKLAEMATAPDADPVRVEQQVQQVLTGTVRRRVQVGLSMAELARVSCDLSGERAMNRSTPGYVDQEVIPTGWTQLDRLLGGGWPRPSLIYLGGRPGMGKTAVMLRTIVAAAKQGRPSAIFSLEMGALALFRRLVAAECGIETERQRSGEILEDEWPMYLEAINLVAQLPIRVFDQAGLSVAEIKSQLATCDNVEIVGIDYVQLMSQGGRYDNENDRLTKISNGLMTLHKETQVTILCLSQLNRATEGRTDKRPTLADFRGSGSMEQDGHILLGCYRDDYYDKSATPNVLELGVLKNREGNTGTVQLYYRPETQRISNLEITRIP